MGSERTSPFDWGMLGLGGGQSYVAFTATWTPKLALAQLAKAI